MGTKENPGKHDCYANAAPDEPLFTLLARDPLALFLVSIWSSMRMGDFEAARVKFDKMIETTGLRYSLEPDVDKASEALDVAQRMGAWANARPLDKSAS